MISSGYDVVHGNSSSIDQRHASNMNSFNTTNNITIGSHNDSSQRYYGRSGSPPPNPPGPDASRNGAPSDVPYPNEQYFPPPAVHPPGMGGATHLPPRSTMNNHNSLNTSQMTVDQSYNENTSAYRCVDVPFSSPEPYASHAQSNNQNIRWSMSNRTTTRTRSHPSPKIDTLSLQMSQDPMFVQAVNRAANVKCLAAIKAGRLRVVPSFDPRGPSHYYPRMDLLNDPSSSSFSAIFELPGIKHSEIDLQLHDGHLVVCGRRTQPLRREHAAERHSYNERRIRRMPGPGGHTLSRAGYCAQDPNASRCYGCRRTRRYVSGAQIQYGYEKQNRPVMNFVPEDVQWLTPEMSPAMNTLMAPMTALDPAAAVQYCAPSLQQMRDSDSDWGSFCDEDDLPGPTDPHRLHNGMVNLSLTDASTHPAYSHLISNPQAPLPMHESISFWEQ